MVKNRRYHWDVNKIIEKIEYLESLLPKEQNDQKRELIRYDIDLLETYVAEYYTANFPVKMPKLLRCYEYMKEELSQSSFFWSEFIKFCDIVREGIKKDYVETPEVPKMILSKDDILALTHDFYKTLNPFFFGNFMKNFYRRFDHVNFATNPIGNYDGASLCLAYRDETFIEIIKKNTIEDALTSIHEFEHATRNSINPNLSTNQNILFLEFDTLFMELIAQDYLKSVINNKAIPIIRYNELIEHLLIGNDICDLISLTTAEETIKTGFTSNKLLKATALKECGIIPQEINSFLFNVYNNSLNDEYLLGYMLAIELYKIYKEDKDKALYMLKSIIMLENTSNEQYYCNIKRLGIIPNLSIREFQKETELELKKALTKQKAAKK